MTERIFLDYLEDIRDEAARAIKFVGELSYAEMAADDRTSHAVVRALEIIGEAAKNVPAHVKERYPEVEWRKMAATRDRLAHGYYTVDLHVVWSTVKHDLPQVIPQMERLLAELDPEYRDADT